MNHRELFANVRTRPGMWLIRPDFAGVVSFVEGVDAATDHTVLAGFREWLVTQFGRGDNLVWWALVADLTEPIGQKAIRGMDPDLDTRAVDTLFELLDEFLELRKERDGLSRIYAAHAEWRRAQRSCGESADSCPSIPWPRAASRAAATA